MHNYTQYTRVPGTIILISTIYFKILQEASISQMLDHGSISFGRYAVEALSWEKKSVFSCNRRQEELEEFRTQGLVAKKKAYFEEYFKRMRAAKSLQDKQQSQTTACYGDDASSRQSGGESKTEAKLKYDQDQVVHVDNVCVEHDSTGESSEEAIHPCEVLHASASLSPKKDSEEYQESCSDYAVQMQVDPKFETSETCIISEPYIDHHGKNSVDDMQILDGNKNLSYNDKPLIDAKCTAPYSRNPTTQRFKISEVENATRGESVQNIRMYKQKSVPASKLKNPSRNELNLGGKRKPVLKPSNKLNLVQSMAENNTRTKITAAADKPLSNYKSISLPSRKSLSEGQSKVTVPRPFSFATDKRSAKPSSLKDDTKRLAQKSLNLMSSFLTREKDTILVQVASEKSIIVNDGKGIILEKKRSINFCGGNKSNTSGSDKECKNAATESREAIFQSRAIRSFNSSRMQCSNLSSMDAKNPRQEKPRWR
ncbi:protein WVD2-like 7 isoform X3 [Canna indica]|uniref:Protein WVD2-like 7 isoform X3 n=1 Tax=Canna indica TaxID=4628 RepID=A0AAQ3KUD0_9LILI|nr:protein WVD2-like 7 isoform X3 [Canna indica]